MESVLLCPIYQQFIFTDAKVLRPRKEDGKNTKVIFLVTVDTVSYERKYFFLMHYFGQSYVILKKNTTDS